MREIQTETHTKIAVEAFIEWRSLVKSIIGEAKIPDEEIKGRCSICERGFLLSELKEADDFDPRGNHRYLSICDECESDFDKIDITFSFLE